MAIIANRGIALIENPGMILRRHAKTNDVMHFGLKQKTPVVPALSRCRLASIIKTTATVAIIWITTIATPMAPAISVISVISMITPGQAFADSANSANSEWDKHDEKRYYNLLNELRCLVCQNQSLADSDASLAGDLRDQVKRMITEGANDEEIKAFMTGRYGDFVLYDPPLKPSTYILWWAPFLILIIVLSLLMHTVAKRARSAKHTKTNKDPEAP